MKKLLPLFILSLLSAATLAQNNERCVVILEPYIPMHDLRVAYSPFTLDSNANFYDGSEYYNLSTGVFSLTYTYRLSRVIELGANVSYWGEYDRSYGYISSESNIAFGPVFRCVWFRSKSIRMYSAASLGLRLSFGYHYIDDNYTYIYPSGSLIPLGLAWGKRFSGSLSLCASAMQATTCVSG